VALPADSPEILDRFHGAIDLVPVIAGQMRRCLGTAVELDDLLSYGRAGLLDAARRFDPQRAVPFRAYATLRVRGTMIDGIRSLAPLPRRTYERLRGLYAMDRVSEGVIDDTFAVGPAEISPLAADLALADHLANLATAMAIGIIATPARGEEGDIAALSQLPSPEEAVEKAELRNTVLMAIRELPRPEAELLQRHYIQGDRFDEIASELGLNKSWATRLHAKAISRLAKRLKLAGIGP
jgi:RNA polymerase sigma factor for flagellar operon FliA